MQYQAVRISIVLLVFLVFPGFSQKRPPKRSVVERGRLGTVTVKGGPQIPPEVAARREAFFEVWLAIKETYYDSTFGGLDWDKIKAEYEPKVKAAKTDAEAHELLNKMISRLGRSHLAVIPPEYYSVIDEVRSRVEVPKKGAGPKDEKSEALQEVIPLGGELARFGIGIDLKLIENRFIISRVDEGSAAAAVGLKTGYSIEKINGYLMSDMIREVQQYHASIRSPSLIQHLAGEIVELLINAEPGTYLDITYSDEGGTAKDMRVPRNKLVNAGPVYIAHNFPERTLSFQSSSLNEKVGYIRFNHFAVPVISKFCAAVEEHRNKESLIIDLRGNSGGMLAVLPVLSGMLASGEIDLGTVKYRSREERLVARSRKNHFLGNVIMLVDSGSASVTEVLALSFKENGRAILVGEKTAGEVLLSIAVPLATGAVFQYPIAGMKSSSGKIIEGSPIVPDVVVALDRKSLLEGRDTQLEAALKVAAEGRRSTATGQLYQALSPPSVLALTDKSAQSAPASPPPPVAKSGGDLNTAKEIRDFPPGHDARSQRVLTEYFAALGGKSAVAGIKSYRATGSIVLESTGTALSDEFEAFRVYPDKYAERHFSKVTGESRQRIEGQKIFVESEVGIDLELPVGFDVSMIDPLAPIIDLARAQELFPSLVFTGEYERDGRKAIVIEGFDGGKNVVAFAFDAQTKMLVNFTSQKKSISYGDYRKTGGFMIPHAIERNGFSLKVREWVFNSSFDPAVFERKVYCFDQAPKGKV